MNVIRTLVLGICLGFICGGRKDKSYPQPKEYNTNMRPTWRPPIGLAPPDASVEDDVRRVRPPVAAGRHGKPPRHRRGKRHSFIRGREREGGGAHGWVVSCGGPTSSPPFLGPIWLLSIFSTSPLIGLSCPHLSTSGRASK